MEECVKEKKNFTCGNSEIKIKLSVEEARKGIIWSVLLGEPVSRKHRTCKKRDSLTDKASL